ncbi:MAG: hypothetical protein EOP02_05605 [Proteobacteria bacterium]|nr:MAG: hypothetical protein EOP02_05605 [Pseudomonadota bacterium]
MGIAAAVKLRAAGSHSHSTVLVAGFVPKRPLDVGQVYTALGLVSAGVGIAFAPASVQRMHFDGLLYKPLRGRPLESTTYLTWLQPAPPILLTAFVEIAMQVMGETAMSTF